MALDPRNAQAASRSSGIEALDEPSTDVSPVVVEAIGKALKAHYRAIADIPLPDRLKVLLAELEARERRHDR